MTSLEAALEWQERQFYPVPVPFRKKGPEIKGWQQLRIIESDAPKYFNGKASNIGVLLGEPYGATDLDLDSREALVAAELLAPPTKLIFGHTSSPASHRFYRCDPPVVSRKFCDPTTDGQDSCLVELRCLTKSGTIGLQTVVPPSVHPSGEQIEFEPGCDGEPANIAPDELIGAAEKLAAVALLGRHWPSEGKRHDAFLALAGILCRAGWKYEDATAFHFALYRTMWGEASDHKACAKEVETTFHKYAAEDETTGFPRLAELIDRRVLKTAMNWLHIESKRGPNDLHLILGDKGKPLPLLANAEAVLHAAPEWEGVLALNEFRMGLTTLKPPPWPGAVKGRDWTDQDDRQTAIWLQRNGVHVGGETAGQAAQTVAHEQRFHPVRIYLDSLRWDSTTRIDNWLTIYLGADHSPYTAAIGARWLISAVARINRPGCKADCCLILEGPQGIKKSTAMCALAGDEWFTDDLSDLGGKDAAMQLRGVWIVELPELDALKRADVARIKSFMSRSTDRFRPPYGRRVIDSPRQCVFVGTVNQSSYLRDETGARRFWPVRCGVIDVEGLARDRDQLWAEASDRFRAGATWWLDTPELNQLATSEQAERYEHDVWDGLIATFVAGRQSVSIEEILSECLEKPKEAWGQKDRNRIGKGLRALGWEAYRQRTGPSIEHRYRPRP